MAEKIPLPEERPGTLFAKGVEHFIRFGALANAGGAVAIITVIGAITSKFETPNILALPLGLFASGVICAFLATAAAVVETMQAADGEGVFDPRFEAFLARFNWSFDIGMAACFILGFISGVAIIALA